MKKLIILLLGLVIGFPLAPVSAQTNDSAIHSIFIRLYIDSTKGIIHQDMEQDLLGPSLRLDTSVCAAPTTLAGKYSAHTRSQDSSVILENYPLGDLQLVVFKDSLDPKTGIITGGPEIQSKGTINICVPFSTPVTTVEIFDSATGKNFTRIDISGLIKNEQTATPEEILQPSFQNTEAIPVSKTTNHLLLWILAILALLIIGGFCWKFFKRKSIVRNPVSSEEV